MGEKKHMIDVVRDLSLSEPLTMYSNNYKCLNLSPPTPPPKKKIAWGQRNCVNEVDDSLKLFHSSFFIIKFDKNERKNELTK